MCFLRKILRFLPICTALSLAVTVLPLESITVGAAESYVTQCEEMLKIINQKRAEAGVEKLQLYIPACSAAKIRAKELVTEFSHSRPDGKGFDRVLSACNISTNKAAENIAYCSVSWTSADAMEAWMNSPSHRDNILSPNYKYFGVGVVEGKYWEQLFIGDITKKKLSVGDVNGDGAIDAIDASAVLEFYAYSSVSDSFMHTNEFKDAADVDGTGAVDAMDASKILKYYADKAVGKPASLPRQ